MSAWGHAFSWLDGVIVLALLAGGLVGMKMGAVSAFFSLLGGVAGGWAASGGYKRLIGLHLNPSWAYAIVFGVVAFCFVVAGFVLSRILRAVFLGVLDRAAGALLGVFLSFILISQGLIPVLLNEKFRARAAVHRSFLAPLLMKTTKNYLLTPSADLWAELQPLLETR